MKAFAWIEREDGELELAVPAIAEQWDDGSFDLMWTDESPALGNGDTLRLTYTVTSL